MNAQTPGPDRKELHFLLDRNGSLIVFQEKGTSWAGVLAFSNEQHAQQFVTVSNLEVHEIATLDTADAASVAELVANIKQRAIRYLLLDLDYHTGRCVQVEFEGDGFGAARERQLGQRESVL